MKQLRLLGLALMAVFALGALVSGTASADNAGILFLFGEEGPIAFSIKGGGGTLAAAGSALKLACAEVTGEAESVKEEEGKKTQYKLGTGVVTFKGCKETKGESKGTCNTAGAASETIVVKYGWHIFDALEGTTLKAGISLLILEPPLVIKCFAGTAKVEVKGAALGLLKCLPGQECLAGVPSIKEIFLAFIGLGVLCDSSGTYCPKVKLEPFLASFNGTFEAGEETAEATLASITKGEAKAKMWFFDD
jgi:hypothetical protein